jgi:hypothetical protein
MPRGHGLGMANALTTVMQVGITLTSMYYLRKDLYREINFGLLSFNDDMVVGLEEDLCREYAECHFNVCEGLSLKMKRRKTFFGNTFVFCEEFSNEVFNSKGAYYRGFINSIFFARNIVQAKQLLTSVPFTHVSRLEYEMDRVIAHWGYEFHRKEFKAPIAFGGWWTKKMNGVDLTFLYPPSQQDMFAYWACKARYGKLVKIPHPRQDFLEEDMSIYIRNRMFDPDEINDYYDKLYEQRQKIFEQEISKSLMEIFEDYRNDSNIDVLPPLDIAELVDFDEASFSISHNELHGIENYYNYYGLCRPSKYTIKERFSFLFPRYEDRLINKPFHFKSLKLNYLISYANIDISENLSSANYIYALDNDISLEEYYIEPTNVALITMAVHPSLFARIPIYKKLEKTKYKLDLYGGYLRSEHMRSMELLKDHPHLWKLVFKYSYEEIEEALNIILKQKSEEKVQEEELKDVSPPEKEEDDFEQYLNSLRLLLKQYKANNNNDPFSKFYSGIESKALERLMGLVRFHSVSGQIQLDFKSNLITNKDSILEYLDKSQNFYKSIEDILKGSILELKIFQGRLIFKKDLFELEPFWEYKITKAVDIVSVIDEITDLIDDNDGDIFSFLDDM